MTSATTTALWKLTGARVSGDSFQSAMATATFLQASDEEVLTACIDELVASLRSWAQRDNLNPACLATRVASALESHTGPAGRIVLSAAEMLLGRHDPHGEQARPHDHCQGWDASQPSPRVGGEPDGTDLTAELLASTRVALAEAGAERGPVTFALASDTAPLLERTAWGESGSDVSVREEIFQQRSR